ncbi:imidazolonepropionase [Aminivibrio sp.]|jgi:imidazolonepropionase|uniref:imidazolonepropionase n=1 Tax=Aminivibrio sp. TaxID=1872489 RepID=UPI001A5B55CC|nr:imidazolonepropionase [Aminivibrio sp.]MBL3539904.1 imidazolonepropionase [Aminivibrio sp.]MDK2958552.1 imidazolonepropionase [Synergistaceae bacterium]
MITKLVRNARIYTPEGSSPSAGKDQGALRFLPRGAMVVRDGLIEAVGPEEEILSSLSGREFDEEIDCGGRCVIPGFVDPHTHMCFARRREEEFSLRLAGTPYLEILQKGGGILSSVRSVREATEDDLFENTLASALSALSLGTTTVEMKSGYGLDTETELRMLSVIRRVGRETPLDVVPTFMGAHAVPELYRGNGDGYVDLLVEEMLPAVEEQGIARFCDVFCEEGVFSAAQTERILAEASRRGLGLKVHADEVHDTGGAALAARMGAVSAEHLLAVSDEGIGALAKSGTTAILLPATAYSLRKPYARARAMIEHGVPVALATDCNPGSSFTESMPFVFGLAVMAMGLTVEEALTAATKNSACAVGMGAVCGTLEAGKQADFLLLDGETPAVLAYHAGVPAVEGVCKKGEQIR